MRAGKIVQFHPNKCVIIGLTWSYTGTTTFYVFISVFVNNRNYFKVSVTDKLTRIDIM